MLFYIFKCQYAFVFILFRYASTIAPYCGVHTLLVGDCSIFSSSSRSIFGDILCAGVIISSDSHFSQKHEKPHNRLRSFWRYSLVSSETLKLYLMHSSPPSTFCEIYPVTSNPERQQNCY